MPGQIGYSASASKKFRAAKKKLSVASRRDGFGRGGEWSWALPASLTVGPAETAADITPEVPTSVIYADHSRPVRSGNADQTTSTGVLSAPIEPTQTGRVPLEWLAGVASLGRLQAPAGIPRHRWQVFVDDCARFLDPREAWAERAADLRWDATPCSDVIQHAPWIT